MEEEMDLARGLSGINFILGLWMVISPFILSYDDSVARWNQIIFGAITVFFAFIRYLKPEVSWPSIINIFSGLWLAIAPFILAYSVSAASWNEVIVGLLITLLAFWNSNIYIHHNPHHRATR